MGELAAAGFTELMKSAQSSASMDAISTQVYAAVGFRDLGRILEYVP